MDSEGLLNAQMVRRYKTGIDYGQIEYMGNYATDELNKKFDYNDNYLSIQKGRYLHELIEEFDSCYINKNARYQENVTSII